MSVHNSAVLCCITPNFCIVSCKIKADSSGKIGGLSRHYLQNTQKKELRYLKESKTSKLRLSFQICYEVTVLRVCISRMIFHALNTMADDLFYPDLTQHETLK